MKNFTTLFIFVLLVPFMLSSQTDTANYTRPSLNKPLNGFLTFGLGRAIPKGYLAWQNVQSDSAGLAINGLDVKLAFGYLFQKQIGVCFTYFNQSFGINTGAIESYFTKLYSPSSFSMQVISGWKLKGVAFGLFGKIALDNKNTIFIEPHALIGLANGRSPEFTITEYIKTTTGTTPYFTSHQQRVSSDPVVCYMIGGSLKMELGQKFCISGSVDYLDLLKYTQYNNAPITYDTNVGPNPPSDTYSFSQQMRSLALTASIGFRFGNRLLFE